MNEEDKARVRAYMRSRSHCWGDVDDVPEEKDDDGKTQSNA